MMKRILIVTNFNAGRKQAIKYKKSVISFVLKYTKDFKFVDIDELKELDVAPFDTIFAMGGDGTVNKVLPYLVNTEKVLGIIPCGTANLLAAKLGLSSRLGRILRIIEKQKVKKVDVLAVNENFSALRCGFGYDSDIICKTPQSLKNKFGYFAYFIAGILFGFRLKNKKYDITIDGKKYSINSSCIIFANATNMYKNCVSVGNNSNLDDGLMDIFILKMTNPIIFFFEFLLILLNIRKNSFRAEYLKGEEVQIENNWSVCHIDGEKKNLKENIKISVLKNSVSVFCV
ncbi:hypothetical protein IKQ21_04875 [bacterium]|nr:hypothetical protein [bacterium]